MYSYKLIYVCAKYCKNMYSLYLTVNTVHFPLLIKNSKIRRKKLFKQCDRSLEKLF